MLRRWRWAAVAVGVAVLVSLPAAIAALPTLSSGVTAAALLNRVRDSGSVPFSGYAESAGSLGLPVTDQLSSLTDLLGGQTQMRAWWRSGTDWRVDTITVTGESDTHRQGPEIWGWDYESNTARVSIAPREGSLRLPTSADLLPTNLGRRLLSGATAAEVSRLPVRRVAGRAVPGLRLRPATPGSTIDHVDVWADARTGLPLRVDVAGAGTTVLSSQFLDFSTSRPSAADTAFRPPQAAQVYVADNPDLASLGDQFGLARAPDRLAGFTRNGELPANDSLGVYGRGVTEFVAYWLPYWGADPIRDQLTSFATTPVGKTGAIGPLSMVLTPDNEAGAWLLAGTVTLRTLTTAARQLRSVGP